MEKFQVSIPDIEGIMVIEPRCFSDDRGFFLESYHKRDFEILGISEDFVQDNHSCSKKGVIRGLHYQSGYPQGKLVRVLRGSIYDVTIDIRKGSPHFGKYFGINMSSKDHRMVYVPVGFAHGFLSLEDRTEVQYKTTDYYHPEYDAGILWNDPAIGITWPLNENGIHSPVLSAKDADLPLLVDIDSPFEYQQKDKS
jgi:dTDP-4-dehydrorhamnose 3,5-epimerase